MRDAPDELAAAAGSLEYATPGRTARPLSRRGELLIKWAVAVLLVLVLVSVLLPAFTRTDRGTPASTVRCMSNVRQILMACQLYAGSNRGRFPARHDELMVPYKLPAHLFVCPLAKDMPTTGPTLQAQQAVFARGGHCSYVYTGAGLTVRSPAGTGGPLRGQAEPPGQHGRRLSRRPRGDGQPATPPATAGGGRTPERPRREPTRPGGSVYTTGNRRESLT